MPTVTLGAGPGMDMTGPVSPATTEQESDMQILLPIRLLFLGAVVLLGLVACGDTAQLLVSDGTGPSPKLPPANPSLLPTVNIAPARGWPSGAAPRAAAGTRVAAFAVGLDHPRWLLVLPNGDVLVAETNAPPKPKGRRASRNGWRDW